MIEELFVDGAVGPVACDIMIDHMSKVACRVYTVAIKKIQDIRHNIPNSALASAAVVLRMCSAKQG